MLCLVFEDSASFPTSRSELYAVAISILLRKWDASRNIERNQIYRRLSLNMKEELLSEIAFATFERGEYFFKQIEIEREIQLYIHNLADIIAKPEISQPDAHSILKSIEAHHGLLVERARGIYSFSHRTLHEFFTARKVVNSIDSELIMKRLLVHIAEQSWREVFLLSVEMSYTADPLLLLMKNYIDALLAADSKLQSFLIWIAKKSESINLPYNRSAIRAFYFALTIIYTTEAAPDIDQIFALTCLLDNSSKPESDFKLDLYLSRILTYAIRLDDVFDDTSFLSLISDFEQACTFDFNSNLEHKLKQLRKQLPNQSGADGRGEFLRHWWQLNGNGWSVQLRAVLTEYRNIGYDWKFSSDQLESLRGYYDANKLLVECLNANCRVSHEVRMKIEYELMELTTPQPNKTGGGE
jgi:predicted NACHT family NTPase